MSGGRRNLQSFMTKQPPAAEAAPNTEPATEPALTPGASIPRPAPLRRTPEQSPATPASTPLRNGTARSTPAPTPTPRPLADLGATADEVETAPAPARARRRASVNRSQRGRSAKELLVELTTDSTAQRLVSALKAQALDVELVHARPDQGFMEVALRTPPAFTQPVLAGVVGFLNRNDIEVDVLGDQLTVWIPEDYAKAKKRTTIRLPIGLVDRAKKYADATESFRSHLYTDSVHEYKDRLQELFPDTYDPQAPEIVRRRKELSVPAMTDFMTLTRPQEVMLSEAVRVSGAGNNSALIETTLERYLTERGY